MFSGMLNGIQHVPWWLVSILFFGAQIVHPMALTDLGPNIPQVIAVFVLPFCWFLWPFSLIASKPESRDDPAIYALLVIFLVAASAGLIACGLASMYQFDNSSLLMRLTALCALLFFVLFSSIFAQLTKPHSPVVRPLVSFFAILFTVFFSAWLKNETRLAAEKKFP